MASINDIAQPESYGFDILGLVLFLLFLCVGVPLTAVYLEYQDQKRTPLIQVGNAWTLPEKVARH